MQLTCPTCQSGLEVPDGTTAHVRCPTCKGVFAAVAGLAPPPPPPPVLPSVPAPKPTRSARDYDEEEDDRPHKKPQSRDDDDDEEDDDDRPRKKRRGGDIAAEEAEERERKSERRRRREAESKLSPEEKKNLHGQFQRAMWGSRLIQISILFYIPAVLLIPVQIIVFELTKEHVPALLIVAGLLGLVNWILGAIGTGLCLSGPVAQGLYRYGISACIVMFVHFVLLLALIGKTGANSDFRELDKSTAQWGQLATQYESLSFYLAFVVYPDDIPIKRSDTILSFITGAVEMTRLILILMMLASLAEASGDNELHGRCMRMAGRASIIPALLALGVLAYKVILIETGAETQAVFVGYLLRYIFRSINAVAAGILLMVMQTVRDVAEACEFPYQSHLESDR